MLYVMPNIGYTYIKFYDYQVPTYSQMLLVQKPQSLLFLLQYIYIYIFAALLYYLLHTELFECSTLN